MMIGALDRRVVVWRPIVTPDATHGGPETVWEPLVPLSGTPVTGTPFWAQIEETLPGRAEIVQQGIQQSRKISKVRMRWRDDIDATMRIVVDDGRTLQIISGPTMVGRKEWIVVVCEELSTEGTN